MRPAPITSPQSGSYGCTVVGEAGLHGGLAVDDIVTAGSPGMHTDNARNLHIDPHHVWAGSAPDDPVSNPVGHAALVRGAVGPLFGPALTGFEDADHGPSPQYAGFGANWYVTDTSGHSDYWNANTESIRNQARVIVGAYSDVGLNHGQRPPDLTT
jgi:hypothetical protein